MTCDNCEAAESVTPSGLCATCATPGNRLFLLFRAGCTMTTLADRLAREIERKGIDAGSIRQQVAELIGVGKRALVILEEIEPSHCPACARPVAMSREPWPPIAGARAQCFAASKWHERWYASAARALHHEDCLRAAERKERP